MGARNAWIVALTLSGVWVLSAGCSLIAPSDDEAMAGGGGGELATDAPTGTPQTPPGMDGAASTDSSPTSDGSMTSNEGGCTPSGSMCNGGPGSPNPCCSGFNCRGMGMGSPRTCQACKALTNDCMRDFDCCSGHCETNKCAACAASGSRCDNDGDCCNMNCNDMNHRCN